MKNFDVKLKRIFAPFLIISAGTIITYSFLRWLLFIKYNLFVVDQDILDFWAPFTLPLVPIFLWLRPRIKLLNLKNKGGKGDPLFAFMIVAWIAMSIPTIIAQSYLETATGKLTTLQRISQIDSLPQTKFYTVKDFYPDKQLARLEPQFKTSGKDNENFDMYLFGVVPLFDANRAVSVRIPVYKTDINPNDKKEASVVFKGPLVTGARNKANGIVDTISSIHDNNINYTPYAWLAIKYKKTVSSHLSPDEKEEKYKQFAKESYDNFRAKALDKFDYLDRAPYSWDLKGYEAAIASEQYTQLQTSKNILLPVYEKFEARNGSKLPWIFGSFGIGAAIFLIALVFKPLKKEAATINLEEERQKDSKLAFMWLKVFVMPQSNVFVTGVLMQLNLLIFIIMMFSGLGFMSFDAPDLLKWGANFRPYVAQGEYWRLLTSMFLHGGCMHILMNMFALFFAGLMLEPVIGHIKYLALYFFCGIAASIASIWWHPATVSVGASGAIFGLFGALFALASVNVLGSKSRKSTLIDISIFVGYNLLIGLAGGIDNAAHIGGLLSGLILGYVLSPFIKIEKPKKSRMRKTPKITHEITTSNIPPDNQ